MKPLMDLRNWIALAKTPDFTEPVIETLVQSEVLRSTGETQAAFHQLAAETAWDRFGRRVFVRAVVEISNYCRENCRYCGMRRDNRRLHRHRAQVEQLAELLLHHRPARVTDINIQAGEDPIAVREIALPLIRILRQETSLGISVCLGTLNPALYHELQSAGATIYIMKFEIADADLYEQMQAPGTFQERIEHIRWLGENGWNVSSGFIAGLPGETERLLHANFELARKLPLAGCSVSPFIPGDETPLANAAAGDINLTLNCMAALRLMRPDWVIPSVSALNLAEPGAGYRRGLRTGANLVTINLTPSEMRGDYLLYKRDRFIMTEERILNAIEAEGLEPSEQSLSDYFASRRNGAPKGRPENAAVTAGA
ncbi:MAG: radical SAM protein [Verrucomicrobiota bacterium]